MRRLTPLQRYTFYCILLEVFEDNIATTANLGFCLAIDRVSDIEVYKRKDFENYFPELYKQRPNDDDIFWWGTSNRKPRIKALKKAIKLITEKITSNG